MKNSGHRSVIILKNSLAPVPQPVLHKLDSLHNYLLNDLNDHGDYEIHIELEITFSFLLHLCNEPKKNFLIHLTFAKLAFVNGTILPFLKNRKFCAAAAHGIQETPVKKSCISKGRIDLSVYKCALHSCYV